MLAARGAREVEGKAERVEDEALVAAWKQRARGIWGRVAIVTAVAASILFWL